MVVQVLQRWREVQEEMQEACRGGDPARLQGAIKGGVTWLTQNGSNPDVAQSSTEVHTEPAIQRI